MSAIGKFIPKSGAECRFYLLRVLKLPVPAIAALLVMAAILLA
ncbi:hypothetical protein [Aeromonas veronii]